jgi:hypothetical protein
MYAASAGGTAPTGFDATFFPYLNGTSGDKTTSSDGLAPAQNSKLVALTNVGQFQLNLADSPGTSNGVYYVFGLGRRCSLVGNGIANAPVNFFDKGSLNPSPANTRYARYGVVFQVNGAVNGGTTLVDFNRAKLVRIFRFGGTLATGDDAIQSYWQDVNGNGGS